MDTLEAELNSQLTKGFKQVHAVSDLINKRIAFEKEDIIIQICAQRSHLRQINQVWQPIKYDVEQEFKGKLWI